MSIPAWQQARWRWFARRASTLSLLCMLAPSPAFAASTVLSFVVVDAAPYGALSADGTATGIYPEILARLSIEIGTPIKIAIVPFARATTMVSNGVADGTLLFKTSLTDQHAIPVAPLFSTSLVVILAPGSSPATRSALAGRVVGRIRGGCQELENAEAGRPTFHEVNNHRQGIALLTARRIDAFCTSEVSLDHALAQYDVEGTLAASPRLHIADREVWLHLRQNISPALVQRMKEAVLRMRQSGSIDQLVRGKKPAQ